MQIPGVSDEWSTVPFVVDSGASVSVVHPADAMTLLRLRPADLLRRPPWAKSTVRASGVGGTTELWSVQSSLRFLRDNGTLFSVETDLFISELSSATTSFPSLMGWDLLQLFAIHMDWSRRVVELSET